MSPCRITEGGCADSSPRPVPTEGDSTACTAPACGADKEPATLPTPGPQGAAAADDCGDGRQRVAAHQALSPPVNCRLEVHPRIRDYLRVTLYQHLCAIRAVITTLSSRGSLNLHLVSQRKPHQACTEGTIEVVPCSAAQRPQAAKRGK